MLSNLISDGNGTGYGDGWLCPYMGEGGYAGPKLVEIGQAEKHPDKDWYRAIKQQQQPQQEQDDAECLE